MPMSFVPSDAGLKLPYYPDSNVYLLAGVAGNVSAGTVTPASSIRFIPFWVNKARTFTAIAFDVATLGSGALARAGVYSIDANGKPFKVLAEGAEQDCSTIGVKPASISLGLAVGWYYACYHGNGTGSAVLRSYTGGGLLGNQFGSSSNNYHSLFRTKTYGPLSDENNQTYTLDTANPVGIGLR